MVSAGDMLVLTKSTEWHNVGCLLFVHETVEDALFVDDEKVKCTYFVTCLTCGGEKQYVRDLVTGEWTKNFECIIDYKALETRPTWDFLDGAERLLMSDAVDEPVDFFLQHVDSLTRIDAIVAGSV